MAISANRFPPSLRAGHCEFLEVDEAGLDTSGLHTHLVSPATRDRLLCLQHTPRHVENGDAATALLADLQHLAPSVAKHFRSRITSRNDASFRLINDLYFEEEEDSYIAISYVWHKASRDIPKKLVSPVGDLPFGWIQTVEQFPLPTAQGTFQAVLLERRANEGLWFDQVCIKQENEVEKNLAISCMDTIYRNARMVVVALDDISATWDEVQFLEGYYQQYVSSSLPLGQHPNHGLAPPIMQQHPVFRSFVERVLSSLWFERAWCVHEMRMGRNLVFLVPCDTDFEDESTRTIVRFTDSFFVHMLVLAREVVASSAMRKQVQTLLTHFTNHNEHKRLSTQFMDSQSASLEMRPLVPTIAEIFGLKAGGDPRLPAHLQILSANRDKTSIALNLCAAPIVLTPPSPFQRPSIEDECLRSLLLLSLASRDPLALCTTGHFLRLHDNSPSWLCAPSLVDSSSSHTTPPRFPPPSSPFHQTSDGLADSLHLSLVFISLPHCTQPPKTFRANLDRAHSFITLCLHHRVEAHPLFTLSQTAHRRASSLQTTFVQALACVLECGAPWLLDVLSEPHICLAPDTTLSPLDAATACARLASGLLSRNDLHAYNTLIIALGTLIATGIPWASGATEVSHGPLVVSAPKSSSTSGKALFFAPFAESRSMQVAVPDVIKGGVYAGLARGWVLTSRDEHSGGSDDEVRWVLRGKGILFGEAGFNDGVAEGGGEGGGEGEGTRKTHRVYGPG